MRTLLFAMLAIYLLNCVYHMCAFSFIFNILFYLFCFTTFVLLMLDFPNLPLLKFALRILTHI